MSVSICPHCNTPFTPRNLRQRYCGKSCKRLAADKRYRITHHTARQAYRQRHLMPEDVRERRRKQQRTVHRHHAAMRRAWLQRNPHKRREYDQRYRATPRQLLLTRLGNRLRNLLNKNRSPKHSRTISFIGCSLPQLLNHIERQFRPGMNWGNRHLWHVDHIRPCASFDLTDPDQQRACFHFTNLRPLWKHLNQRKGANEEFLI